MSTSTRVVANLSLTSVLSPKLSFASLVVERPVVHIILYPDGTTNQPGPKLRTANATTAVQKLFSLSVSELEIRAGELLWNDRKIPFDVAADDVSADLGYSVLHSRYEVNLLVGKGVSKFQNFRPVAWTASAHFRLREEMIELRSLKATSGRSNIEISGTLVDFANPRINAVYDGEVDLKEVAAVGHVADLRNGRLALAGKGSGTVNNFQSTGRLEFKNLELQTASANIRGANLSTSYSVDSQHLNLPDLEGKLLGGAISGSTEISAWQDALSRKEDKKNSQLSAVLRLKLKAISSAEIAQALSTPQRPFARMKVVGAVTGTLDARWKGSAQNAIADFSFDAVPPISPKAGELAVSGHTKGSYRYASGELQIAEFSAATRATQVHAAGTLSASALVTLNVTTSNLGEWQPVLVALGYDEPQPIRLLGPASFTGTATGKLSSITFAGKLQSGNFDFVVPATSKTPEQDVHWDSLNADIRLSPAGISLRNSFLRRNSTDINFDINLGLTNRHFSDTSPFTARVVMKHANLNEILSMAGYSYPISGNVDFFAQLSGSQSEPEGNGRIEVTDALVRGYAVHHFDSDLEFRKGEVIFRNTNLAQGDERVTGDLRYTFLTHAFEANAIGNHFQLGRISWLQGDHLAVEGGLDFKAHASGTLDNPVFDGTIHLHELSFNHELAGEFTLAAVSHGETLQVSGVSQFQNAELKLDGNIQPRGNWMSSLDLQFNHLDVDPVLREYLQGHLTGHSMAAGNIHLDGPLRHPRELAVTGTLTDLSVDIENVQLKNNEPFRFGISNHLLTVKQLHLTGENTDLSGEGSIQLSGERQLDFKAKGQVNLQLIQSYNPDFTSAGMVTVDMRVGGTAASPVAQGKVQIKGGSIAYVNSTSTLGDINGTLNFSQNRLDIESLTGHIGGGLVSFQGHAEIYNHQTNFEFGVHGTDVRLRYPAGVSSTANLDLQFAGSSAASTLSGEIMVTKLAITPGFDFGAYLQRSAQSSALPQTSPTLNRIRLDVHIATLPELQMQTAVIRLSGDADLRLRGTAAKSVLLGRADVLEGQAYFNGTKYRVERGDVTFTNPVSTSPVLDLQASTQVRDYDITLNLNGEIDKLNLTYRSEPPLPTSDIIALLAFGQASQESSQLQQAGQSSFNQEASNAILAAALDATVSNRAQRLFGVSHIKIDPQGLNTETSPTQSGPAVTIEQQVASNITVSYSTNVSQTSQQVIQAEYNVSRNISVVAIRDQNGVVSFDVRIRQRKK